MESMRDAFYSAPGTPRQLNARSPTTSHTNLQGFKQKHPNWLDMTAAPPHSGVPKLDTPGLQLASPMISPSQSHFNMPGTSTSSELVPNPPNNAHSSLGEKYYGYYEESDEETESPAAPEETWDQESLTSRDSVDSDTLRGSPDRDCRDSRSSSHVSPVTPHDPLRASSLARLRTQLEENNPHAVPPQRSKISGTIVSLSVLPLCCAASELLSFIVTIQRQQSFLWLSSDTLPPGLTILHRQAS
jgi:hypothetical protein